MNQMRVIAWILCFISSDIHAQVTGTAGSKQQYPVWEKSAFSFIPRSFQRDPKADVVILTEFSALGRKLPKVTPSNPVYYVAGDSGMKEEGEVIAGETPAKDAVLKKAMVSSLKTNGYLPYDAKHPPSLVIFFRWGSFNQKHSIDDPMGVNGPDLSNPTPPDPIEIMDLAERAALIGGQDFALKLLKSIQHNTLDNFANSDEHIRWLVDECYTNRYFIIASAYDYENALKKKKVLFWRTKISTNSLGLTMDDSIPALTINAGPFFGRETLSPVKLNRPVIKEGHVDIGSATVIQDSDPFIKTASPK